MDLLRGCNVEGGILVTENFGAIRRGLLAGGFAGGFAGGLAEKVPFGDGEFWILLKVFDFFGANIRKV